MLLREGSNSLDHGASMDEFVELNVQQIASEMGVSVRTVYSHIEKEGWKKKEGARGRVWYLVPQKYLENYRQTAEYLNEDRMKSDDQPLPPSRQDHIPSPPETSNLEIFLEQLRKSHEETLKAKDETIEQLKKQIKDLQEDKLIMTRQIEAGNTALVTMREAKRMQEESRKQSGWMFWKKKD